MMVSSHDLAAADAWCIWNLKDLWAGGWAGESQSPLRLNGFV